MRARIPYLAASVFAATLALGAGAGVVVTGVTGGAQPAGAATTIVHLSSGFTFSPSAITIHVGDTVTWQHDSSSTMHTVTADDGSFDSSPSCPTSGCLGANSSFSHTYTSAGTFRYYCKIHGAPGGVGMSGTVTVLAATPPTTVPGPTTTVPQSTVGTPTSSTPGTSAAPAATPSASLPRTGSNTVPFLVAGAAAILLGVAALFGRRRIRPTR